MDRGPWWVAVHTVEELDMTKATQHTHTQKLHFFADCCLEVLLSFLLCKPLYLVTSLKPARESVYRENVLAKQELQSCNIIMEVTALPFIFIISKSQVPPNPKGKELHKRNTRKQGELLGNCWSLSTTYRAILDLLFIPT